MRRCGACGAALPADARFCPACGAARATASRRTVVERVLEGDWRAAGIGAGLVLLSTVAGAQLVVLSFWLFGGAVDFGPGDLDFDVADYLRAVCLFGAAAFGGGLQGSRRGGEGSLDLGFTPLTVTAMALAATWFASRRYARGTTADRLAFVARLSTLVSLGVLLMALATTQEYAMGDGRAELGSQASTAVVMAFLATAVTGATAALRPLTLAMQQGLPPSWALALRGGAVTLIALLVLGGLAGVVSVVIAIATEDPEVQWGDVARAIPLLVGFGANLAAADVHLGVGGSVAVQATGSDGGGESVSLFDLGGAPGWFWLFVLVLPLAVAVGARYVARRGTGLGEREVARAGYRMGLPVGVGWLVVLVSAGLTVRGSGSATGYEVGVRHPFLGALLVGAATVVLGWALTRAFARGERAGPPPVPSRLPQLTPGLLCVGVAATVVALAASAAAADPEPRSYDVEVPVTPGQPYPPATPYPLPTLRPFPEPTFPPFPQPTFAPLPVPTVRPFPEPTFPTFPPFPQPTAAPPPTFPPFPPPPTPPPPG